MISGLRETGATGPESFTIDRAISVLRDEITAYMMSMYKGNNRNLAMVLTKLDEAEGFAIRHGIDNGRLAIVDRSELLQAAQEVSANV